MACTSTTVLRTLSYSAAHFHYYLFPVLILRPPADLPIPAALLSPSASCSDRRAMSNAFARRLIIECSLLLQSGSTFCQNIRLVAVGIVHRFLSFLVKQTRPPHHGHFAALTRIRAFGQLQTKGAASKCPAIACISHSHPGYFCRRRVVFGRLLHGDVHGSHRVLQNRHQEGVFSFGSRRAMFFDASSPNIV